MKLFKTIPTYIFPSFWVLALLIGWLASAAPWQIFVWVFVVFISVLVHELGHALSARFWNQRTHIELGPFGGLTVRHGPSLGLFREFIVILMGPLCGFFLAFVGYLLLLTNPQIPALIYFYYILWVANMFWSILNLLPVHPLDGGKLMSIGFESIFGLWGVRFSYLVSAFFSLSCTIFFFAYNVFIIGILFLLFTYESFRAFLQERHVGASGKDEKLLDEIELAEIEWEKNQTFDAIKRLEKVVKSGDLQGEVYYRATEVYIRFLLETGETKKAYELLKTFKSKKSLLLQKQMQLACYKLGQYQEALEHGKKCFLEDQDVSCAILCAFCAAALENVQEAISWLRAIKQKQEALFPKILESTEFDSIRNDPNFARL